MAYDATKKTVRGDDEDQPQRVGGSAPTGMGSAATVSRSPAQPQGGGWVGLEKYLDSNRGEGTRMAQAITQPIADDAAKVQDNARAAGDRFIGRVGAGIPGADPAPGDGDPDWQFKSQQKYTGPASVSADEDWLKTYADAGKVQNQVDLMKTAQGRGALTQETFGKGKSYTSGQNRLNSALIGNANEFTQAQNAWGGLLGTLDQQDQDSRQISQAAERQTQKNNATWKDPGPAEANVNPPTDERGRWQKTFSGWWVENPGWRTPERIANQKQIPSTYRTKKTETGVWVYG